MWVPGEIRGPASLPEDFFSRSLDQSLIAGPSFWTTSHKMDSKINTAIPMSPIGAPNSSVQSTAMMHIHEFSQSSLLEKIEKEESRLSKKLLVSNDWRLVTK